MSKPITSVAVIAGILTNSAFGAVPTKAFTFDTNVKTYSLTSSQEAKIQRAEEKIKDVIASEEFRSQVLNHTYKGRKTFVDNKGLTNSQIYDKILQAAELRYPSKNNRMDMGVKLYYENSNTVSYTTRSITYININRKYFNTYTSTQVARNMMHEWLHKLGFEHAVNYSTSRDYSVPYAIGSIVLKLAAKY